MDEYLSEKEQLERIRDWWRENGWYLLGGVVLGAALLLGWNRYQAYESVRAEEAAAMYRTLTQAVEEGTASRALELLGQLRAEYGGSPYADHGGLLVARMQLISNPQRAADELRYVMDNTSDEELAMIARLRLARVLAYQQEYDAALALLNVAEPGAFSGRFAEVRGDVHAALGETEAARAAYRQALAAPAGELLDRSFVQMKLDDLPAQAGEATR